MHRWISRVRRPPWEVPPSRRPIVQRPRADCEDDPVPGRTTRPERKALHNEPRLDDPIRPVIRAVSEARTLLRPAFIEPAQLPLPPLGLPVSQSPSRCDCSCGRSRSGAHQPPAGPEPRASDAPSASACARPLVREPFPLARLKIKETGSASWRREWGVECWTEAKGSLPATGPWQGYLG